MLLVVLAALIVIPAARALDPREMDPKLLASAVAAATGEKVRIVPGASGWNLYGESGTGSVVSSASGYRIYYAGKRYEIVPSGNGWKVYGY